MRSRRVWLEPAIIFAAWTGWALITTYQTSVQAVVRGQSLPMRPMLMNNLLEALLWALATVAVFGLVRRFPVERGRVVEALVVHAVAGAAIIVLRLAILVAIDARVAALPNLSFEPVFWARLNQHFILYLLLPGAAHSLLYYQRYRERERAAERLAAGLAAARLQALKMQLHPHFLFNTLNAISALIPADAQPARRMVARLGDLLRIALDHEETQEVTLREELAFLEPYLEIEQARLGERLTVTMEIDPDTLDARVPHLILQPLLENAVRHAIAPRIDPGTVRISATRRADDRLELQLRDDGPGIARHKQLATRKAVGLGNIQERLEQLYGNTQRFDLRTHPDGGAVVTIVLPLRRGATPSAVTI